MLNKIGLIGGGNIGGVLMQEIAKRRLARVVAMVDVKEPDLAKGKALDIAEGSPTISTDVEVIGGKTYDVIEGADLVINTAGVPRTTRPDGTIPTREELLATNLLENSRYFTSRNKPKLICMVSPDIPPISSSR